GRAMPPTVITVGHSAGGQLAVWAAARHRLKPGAVGADPALKPKATVSLAGVLDLRGAALEGVGDGVVGEFLGGDPRDVPERYAVASPLALLPLGLPTLCVHGTADTNVPPTQSETYVDSARPLGDDVTLEAVDGADHFVVIDPTAEPWRRTTAWIDGTLG
ncbi:MAG: prolyl oligopeptidase family serine peptidase, partial [Microthrixaceae bacterium]|nr:prolyl oligopeptidase family serine peptidase [Microthrixaceae bacterium]